MRKLIEITLLLSLAACSPRVVTQTQVEYRDRIQYDTVHESHTDYIYVVGDTIFRTITEKVYREKIVHDTAIVERHDSIPYQVEVPVYIEKPLKEWQKGMIGVGFFSIFALLLVLFLKFKNL